MKIQDDELLTQAEVCKWLKISRERLGILVEEHGLPAVKIPTEKRRSLRFLRKSVLRWLEAQEDEM